MTKNSLSCSISQETLLIWSSFVVQKCKMIISPGFFFISSKFWFFRLLGGSKGKKGPKCQKNSNSVSQELYLLWLWLLVQMCKRTISPGIFFFHFFKILIFQVFQSSSINAKRKFWGVPHLLHMCAIFCLRLGIHNYIYIIQRIHMGVIRHNWSCQK